MTTDTTLVHEGEHLWQALPGAIEDTKQFVTVVFHVLTLGQFAPTDALIDAKSVEPGAMSGALLADAANSDSAHKLTIEDQFVENFDGSYSSYIDVVTFSDGVSMNMRTSHEGGTSGRDMLFALDTTGVVDGLEGRDWIIGTESDDFLKGGEGSDRVDGGEGADTAYFNGMQADFLVTKLADGRVEVQDTNTSNGDDGTDVLTNIELLAFTDGTFGIDAIANDPTNGQAFAETGTANLDHLAITVTLERSYENPVVVAFVATENGAYPVNVRVSNIDGNELTMMIQEPNHLDVYHASETVNYMVVEAGTWVLPDGTLLEASTLDSNLLSTQGFEAVSFEAEFDAAPVILSQVQSKNGSDFVTTRQKGASENGFQITMQEEEANNFGGHISESIGWIAIEAGSGSTNVFDWIAGSTSGVTNANADVSVGATMTGGVNVIAGLSSFSGSDPAWARGNGSDTDSFSVSAEEDTSLNSETDHVAETVDYFAFSGAGTLRAAPLQEVLETGTVSLDHLATTVTLERSYENPVVVAFVATENGAHPVNVRVSNIDGNELTMMIQEPNHLDVYHASETVNYMVVEAGTWVLPDGTLLEASTLDSNLLSTQGFEAVSFEAEFDAAPVILSQVQSKNGSDFVTTRQKGASENGFQITMQEEGANNAGEHAGESIGWIAIEAGSGSTDVFDWIAGSTSGVTDANADVSVGATMTGGVNVIAGLSSFSGSDPAWTRGNGSDTDSFSVSAEEDTSLDTETSHVAETVDYLAFSGFGVVSAYDYDILA